MNTPRLHDCPQAVIKKTKQAGRFLIEESTAATSIRSRTVIAYFKSRWGEVDGYLPTLHKFKQTHPDWCIIAVIGSERMSNTVDAQPFLYNELRQAVDVLIRLTPQPQKTAKRIFYRKWISKLSSWYHRKCVCLSWRKLFGYLAQDQIQLILKDHGHDDAFLQRLQARFPNAKCVASPHGTGIYLQNNDKKLRKPQRAKVDLFLAGDASELPVFRIFTGEEGASKIEVVGRPRYDQWWIDHLIQQPGFRSSEEYQRAGKSQRVFLFATRGPSSSFFPVSVFEYLVQTVAETVLNQPDTLLLIKPHPQQDIEPIESIMAQYDPNSWKISSLQTIQLAHISDFIICMVSSVILDALAIGKPTVEYFQYVQGQHYFQQDQSGKTISSYCQLGLVATADRKEQLEALITDYFSTHRSDHWEQQQRQTKEFMKLDNLSSHRAVSVIDEALLTKDTPENSREAMATPSHNTGIE